MKTPRLLIVVVLSLGFLLAACAGTIPSKGKYKHYNLGEPTALKELPREFQGALVIHDLPQLAPTASFEKAKQTKHPSPNHIHQPQSPPLPPETRDWLNEHIQQHRSGEETIRSVIAKYPSNPVPKNHMAYQVDNYLKANGISVKVVPYKDPHGTLDSVAIELRR
jgi:hypothetical protein